MAGSYSQEEFLQIYNQINMLRHPYFVYITDAKNCDPDFAKQNMNHSILLYDKKDFI